MNKLLFNEGGQPVFLDDLELMQAEPLSQLGMLLKALGAGMGTYLLKEFSGKYLATDDASGKTVYAVNGNWLVKDGVIYELPETSVLMGDGETLYVGLKTSKSDTRNFDDGQSHVCLQTITGFYSTTKTDDGMVDVKSLKTIWELVAPIIKMFTPEESYKDLAVTFKNGYSGTVQYKDVGDAYRIKVRISSDSDSWDNGKLFVFQMDNSLESTILQSFYANIAYPLNRYATPLHGWLYNDGGNVYIEGVDGSKYAPHVCWVDTIFEIPKHKPGFGNR